MLHPVHKRRLHRARPFTRQVADAKIEQMGVEPGAQSFFDRHCHHFRANALRPLERRSNDDRRQDRKHRRRCCLPRLTDKNQPDHSGCQHPLPDERCRDQQPQDDQQRKPAAHTGDQRQPAKMNHHRNVSSDV